MRTLTGRSAVVTGGTHGMGLAIARALLDDGAEVVATGRNRDNVGKARAELDSPLAHVLRSDAAELTDIDALAAYVQENLGGLDYLFVNHGIAEIRPFDQVTEESWDRHFAVNTKGSFFTVQRLAPLLRDGGAIVLTTVANDSIFPGLSAYSASKEAITAFAQVLAAELAPRRIRVNTLAPGFIVTPTMGVTGLTEDERAAFIAQGSETTPLGRNGTPEEIATAALFLATGATFTTGVELAVDGGYAQGL
ncbi:short-chain dehydrogenase [Prauserella sp. PE36]|uniref:SDR family oxidoreductase n=1 Tax=Prauserella endophytica TaxID=1592324 RepID=A0ABY2S4C9_9PSEU|nr:MULTISPECIES: SDR family oxidoreductase [Prauserella]PXY29856.1 short-chain dehydrogenase [Prauserella coralliicola]RBM11601.1 short-chain dehydrogenase [Prauserella sp. PE36]TKG69668.1 SDR family oxidoreductase [Prauserella endophytica]